MRTMRDGILGTVIVLSLLALLAAGCERDEVPQEWAKLGEKAREQGAITLYVFKYEDYFLPSLRAS